MTTPSTDDLPLGTAPEWSKMHNRIRKVCYVLLFGLVIEGALTFPLLAIWYGFPELSPTEVCSELQKVAYSDDNRQCESHPLKSPPFGGKAEAEGQTTSEDDWGVQPTPGYDTVHRDELIENKEQRDAGAEDDDEDTDE